MGKGKILIVDDEYSFAEFAKILLESRGYEATVCLDSTEALRTASVQQPRLILMDASMPEFDGIDAIRGLKADAATRAIPIILCSVTKNRREVQEAMDCGAVDFIPKPFRAEQFHAQIARALGEG